MQDDENLKNPNDIPENPGGTRGSAKAEIRFALTRESHVAVIPITTLPCTTL